MDKKFAIPVNVNAFLDKAAAQYGNIKSDEFNQLRWMECRSHIESPIEQLFYIALHLVCAHMVTEFEWRRDFSDDNDNLQVIPQWKVSTYAVDFALRRHPVDKIVCVELDGHAFHDRDERQRRYEKKRDRHLQALGYQVLHYTGSEVAKDPCAAALEAFILATGLRDVATHPFEDD
jgi:very-short-patch-repair endonuclease